MCVSNKMTKRVLMNNENFFFMAENVVRLCKLFCKIFNILKMNITFFFFFIKT